MGNEFGVAGIGNGGVQGVEQTQAALSLTQQERPGVGGKIAGGEVGLDAA